jgi:hypothetical protein
MQVGAPGAKALRLKPDVKYLWVISESGQVRVAPVQLDAKGQELIGHPNLLGGKRARLGGVLQLRGGVAVLDSDSGRYGYLDPSLSPKNLKAAAAWIRRVGINSSNGERAEIKTRFVPPVATKKNPTALDRRDLKMGRFFRRHGGYRLLPPRAGKKKALPRTLKSMKARRRWSKQARTKWR